MPHILYEKWNILFSYMEENVIRHFFVKLSQVQIWKTSVDFHTIDSIWTADSSLPIKTCMQKLYGLSLASLTLAYRNISMLMPVGMLNWLTCPLGQKPLEARNKAGIPRWPYCLGQKLLICPLPKNPKWTLIFLLVPGRVSRFLLAFKGKWIISDTCSSSVGLGLFALRNIQQK